MNGNGNRAAEELAEALRRHDEEVLAPIRRAYAEERETLARDHRYKDLAVFDALETLRDVESSCTDECAASQISEVIDRLEAVF
ncbi:hypothetical protein M5J20_01870 [Corynebacterium sp. TA-R-1]|uniref:Uncharacterized protein n=1 Tax=Corynebacterium stercoris TaxID=2943490 RepID=A0ABT1G1V0_9CORY|nr:hypothetical protein [Corynebacterium stercoris]MCP1386943.1 hypothetical protein [Corynebacterium stercoris]